MTATMPAPPRLHPMHASLARRRGTALALLAASVPMFMATLDNLVMTTALPVLRTELSASLEQLQWMVNAYTLSFATLMIAAATLGDRWGRRRVFVAGDRRLRARLDRLRPGHQRGDAHRRPRRCRAPAPPRSCRCR